MYRGLMAPKGEEGYWLKHVAVGEFDMEKMHFKPGTVMHLPQPPTPKCK